MSSILRVAWDRWQIIAKINGDYVARLIVNLFYFTILVPFAIGLKIFSDPLEVRHAVALRWKERPPVGASIEDARSQF